MNMYLRYMGEFLSRAGIVWRVEILQAGIGEQEEIGELTFEAEEALKIEYLETAKEEVICGSTATIMVESPGDRTYEDLYTIEVGAIRMDVYRNNALYWSGTLDPEFYEEPYERLAHYVVSLTFSDFGILDRLKYNLAGMLTLSQIVTHCIGRAGIIYGGIDESLISTSLTHGGAAMSLSDLTVRSDNFYDEDGEASTLKEVLEGILQPLGLRMVQRCGKVWVYDLNGLFTLASTADATWDGDSQTMGVDVVYNNAKITWSTYAQSGNLLPTDAWVKDTDVNLTNINNTAARTYEGSDYYSYFYSNDLWGWADATDVGFTVWLNREGKNAVLSDYFTNVKFFKIVPQYDGSESEGISLLIPRVRGYKIGTSNNWQASIEYGWDGVNPRYIAGTLNDIDKALFSTNHVWVPPVDNANALLIRITFDLLLDPRFNPFEQAANFQKWLEQEDWQNEWKHLGNYLYIPVTVKFKPTGSDNIYVWDNRAIVSLDVNSSPVCTLSQTLGSWHIFNGNDDKPDHWGYLAWYDPADRDESQRIGQGWAKNRPAINPHTSKIASILTNAEDGQYMPYPNFGGKGGEIWIEVRGDGWQISDGNVNLSSTTTMNPGNLWGEDSGVRPFKMNWILFKLPELEIVNNVQFEQAINTDDVEYNAELNEHAKEAIELETICGTSAEGVPTARGAYFSTSTGEQIKTLSRAGRTTQAEELLIGTLYSQYAERRTKLSGDMILRPDGMVAYTEQNQEGKKFILLHETQDVIMDVTDAEIVELRPDEYDKR